MANFDNTTATGQINAIDATYPKPNVNQSSDGFRTNFAAIKGSLNLLNSAVVNIYKNAPLAFSTDSMITRRPGSATSISDLIDGMTLSLDLKDIHNFNNRVFDATNANMQMTIDGKGRVIAISSSPLPTFTPVVSMIPQRTMNSGNSSVASIQIPTLTLDPYGKVQNVTTTSIGPFGIQGHEMLLGSLLVGSTGNVSSSLPRGTVGQVLRVSSSGTLEWVSLPPILAGTVTNVFVGTGLSVTDSSTSPSISLDFKSFTASTTLQGTDNLMSFDSSGSNYKKFTFATLVGKLGETFIGSMFADPTPTLSADMNVNGFKIINGSPTSSIQLVSSQSGKIILNSTSGDIEIESQAGTIKLGGLVTATTRPIDDNTTYLATTAFVKRAVDLKVSSAGGTMTGNLVLSVTPTTDQHAVNKKYVDDAVALKLNLSGGILTGALTLSAAPTANLHAATKKYVDDGITASADTKLNLTGGTLTGLLTLSGAPTTNLHAATKQYVDTGLALKLNLAGGTLTGPLVLSAAPTADLQAATKKYVDDKFALPVLAPVIVTSTIAITGATHAGRMLIANGAAGFTAAWSDTGDGFNCIIINRTSSDLGFTLTGFTSSTPINSDGFTRIRAGGVASILIYSPDGGTTKVFHLNGAGAP